MRVTYDPRRFAYLLAASRMGLDFAEYVEQRPRARHRIAFQRRRKAAERRAR